jgi:glucose/arabinose dehydrogenase
VSPKAQSRAAALLLLVSLVTAACTMSGGATNPAATTAASASTATVQATATTAIVAVTGSTVTVEPAAQVSTAVPATQAPTQPPAATTAAAPAAANVTDFPDASAYEWRPVVVGLVRPTAIVSSRDGSGRLFVLEQTGRIRVLQNGNVLLPTPFLDISAEVGSQGSEQGLLGIDFSPSYAQDGFFYVNYTDRSGNTSISRFKVSSNPDVADPASELKLLQVDQPFPNHNGGQVTFGPDGFLYLGLGDGGSAGDPHKNGQSLNALLGKILRIDVSGGGPTYKIPADNPFASGGGKPEIWAYGLRNPWRFSFDRATGDLYIADVGQDTYEEIDYQPAGSKGGANFGWNFREAAHPFRGVPPDTVTLVDPVFEYSHSQGCSVTGGYVYRGKDLPELNGVYFFSDYCSGNIWGLLQNGGAWKSAQLFTTSMHVTSFGEDQNGELYLLDQTDGSVHKLMKK